MRSRIGSLLIVFGVSLLPCLSHAQTYSKTETIEYSDNLASWVLGQVKRTTTNGVENTRTDYDSTTALPLAIYSFGRLQQSATYNLDGTVATLKDGNGNITTFGSYKLGIPLLIQFPATPDQPTGTSVTVAVDDLGQIRSVVDAAGAKTCYDYDAMGRMQRIQYPSETTVGQCGGSWADTLMSFEPGYPAAYGLPAGLWRQRVTTGNLMTETLFDAFWRPVVKQTYDTSNVNATISQAVTRYDANGRVAFVSYPQRTVDPSVTNTWADPLQVPNALGTKTLYDALDRVTSVTRSAEAGIQDKTTTSYLPGFKTQVTDPNGNVTTTSYMTFDEPTADWPVSIAAPEGINQTVARDAFGSPTSIIQSGTYNGQYVGLGKYFTYDSYHRLCRFYDAESNSTVYSYDNANNVLWLATGQVINGDGTVCGQGQVAASARTTRTYDAMNRVTDEVPPTGTQGTIYHYDPTGRLTITISGIVIQGRVYNIRGLLTGESQWFPNDNNFVRSIGYGYDTYGHLSTVVYPDGGVFGMFPDATGRATVVQGGSTLYASNISYYPNGGTAGYSLNNGITATIQQNARQLPSNITYNRGGNLRFSEAYVYDADANLKTVTDLVNGKNNQTLAYDGLSRLASDTAPNNWGTEAYTYDPLNNIRLHAITGLTLSYNYGATNRLATMTVGTPTGAAFANFQYDARGNQTQSNVVFTSTPHTFDAKNQMLQIPGVATYSYDEAGRRIKKVLANGQVSYFFYSQAGQLMYEYNVATGQATDYLYLNGKLIARYIPGQNPTYLLTDRLGTPVRETDPSGALTQSFSYRPFGGLYSGVSQQQPGYTGHVYDPESSLSYMQARYQDGGLGQFLSVDPVGPTPGNVLNFNRYAYAGNNPIKNVDPDGRAFGIDDLVGSAVGGLVGVGVEATKDLVTGHSMTWGDAAGSFAGGALMGEGIVNAPETLGGSVAVAVAARGAVVGLVSNTVQQTTDIATGDQKGYSVTSAVVSTAVGAVSAGILNKVGTVKVPGITSGSGNMAAVARAVKTRIANGNASNMSAKTIAKGVVGGQVGDAGKTAVGGTIDAAKTTACNHTGGC